jgi:MYXO-CTERM domain-containing protein
VVAKFAQWCYFVGARDDGAHFTRGSEWFGAEVRIDTTIGRAELPVKDAAPSEPLAAYGTTYLELSLDGVGENEGIRLDFVGDPTVAWSVDALLIRSAGAAEVRSLELGESASGELVLDNLAGFTSAVLAITNLATPEFDPDAPACHVKASFGYDLEAVDLATPPKVLGISPSQLELGKQYEAWLSGTDFQQGLIVELGAGIVITAVDFVDSTSVALSLQVSADAVPGPRDVVATNPNGKSSTLAGGVTLGSGGATSGSDEGCGCRTAGNGGRSVFGLVLLALLAALVRRRASCWPGSSRSSEPFTRAGVRGVMRRWQVPRTRTRTTSFRRSSRAGRRR